MHLCNIPEDKIVELNIPNGFTLIYDIKSKYVKLLDNGTVKDLLEVYNCRKTGNYLFKPFKKEDRSINESVM